MLPTSVGSLLAGQPQNTLEVVLYSVVANKKLSATVIFQANFVVHELNVLPVLIGSKAQKHILKFKQQNITSIIACSDWINY